MTNLRTKFKKVRSSYLKDRNIFRCEKCMQLKKLDVHHIIPLADGGTNEYDNLIALCTRCHDEWHTIEGLGIELNRWLTIPPYYVLIKSIVNIMDKEKDLTGERLQLLLKSDFEYYRGFGDTKEVDAKRKRHLKGVLIAKEEGKYKGRKKIEVDNTFKATYEKWKAGEITATKAMELTGLKKNTFYRRVKEYENA